MNEIKRGPGRPKNTERDSHENKQRPPRVSIQAGQKLVFAKRKGYQRYLAIDKPGMLERMEAAWWEYVTDDRGNKITTPAGGGFTHYLMEIKQELYDEDMAKQQSLIDSATREAAELKQNEYVPEGYDGVLTREVLA
jgi:hypothetical protein